MGLADRIPERIARAMVDAMDGMLVHTFPLSPAELPVGTKMQRVRVGPVPWAGKEGWTPANDWKVRVDSPGTPLIEESGRVGHASPELTAKWAQTRMDLLRPFVAGRVV